MAAKIDREFMSRRSAEARMYSTQYRVRNHYKEGYEDGYTYGYARALKDAAAPKKRKKVR